MGIDDTVVSASKQAEAEEVVTVGQYFIEPVAQYAAERVVIQAAINDSVQNAGTELETGEHLNKGENDVAEVDKDQYNGSDDAGLDVHGTFELHVEKEVDDAEERHASQWPSGAEREHEHESEKGSDGFPKAELAECRPYHHSDVWQQLVCCIHVVSSYILVDNLVARHVDGVVE